MNDYVDPPTIPPGMTIAEYRRIRSTNEPRTLRAIVARLFTR